MENRVEYATNDVATRNNSKRAANKSNNIEWRNYNDTLEFNETLGLARVKGTNSTFRAKIDERGRLIEYRGNILPDYRESDYTLDDFDEDFDEDSIKEIYKPIDGYDYEISNTGQVRSVRTGRILKQFLVNGYLRVGLSKDGVEKKFYIHRLVAQAFIPNPKNKPQIDHIDGNKQNNRVDNLRWVTSKENNNNPITKQKLVKAKSKPLEQLNLNGDVLATYPSTIEVERVLGFDQGEISLACRKGVKRYNYYWRYKN